MTSNTHSHDARENNEPFEGEALVRIMQNTDERGRFDLTDLEDAMRKIAARKYRESAGQSAWLFAVDNFIADVLHRTQVNSKGYDILRKSMKEAARDEWRKLDAVDKRALKHKIATRQGAYGILGNYEKQWNSALHRLPSACQGAVRHLIEKDFKLTGRRGSKLLTGLADILQKTQRPASALNIDTAIQAQPVFQEIDKTLHGFNVSYQDRNRFWSSLLAA